MTDDNDGGNAKTTPELTGRSAKVERKKDGTETERRRKTRRGGKDPEERRQKHSSVSFQQS